MLNLNLEPYNMNFIEKFGNDTILRALSWKQPFASLMLHGKIETRVWDTKYRGWVLICASKSEYSDPAIEHIAGGVDGRLRIEDALKDLNLITGKAIAIGYLKDSRPMEINDDEKTFVKYKVPYIEQRLSKTTGKVRLQRTQLYCHVYENVMPIKPIDWVGSQGWSTVSEIFKQDIILL